jgi:hypothetical protein
LEGGFQGKVGLFIERGKLGRSGLAALEVLAVKLGDPLPYFVCRRHWGRAQSIAEEFHRSLGRRTQSPNGGMSLARILAR